jgi:hypothetical protein
LGDVGIHSTDHLLPVIQLAKTTKLHSCNYELQAHNFVEPQLAESKIYWDHCSAFVDWGSTIL